MGILTKKTGSILNTKAEPLGIDFAKILRENSGTSSTKSSSGSKKKKEEAPAAPAVVRPSYSNEKLIGDYTNLFYKQYQPEKLSYTQRTAEEIGAEISAWLRPTYDAAIRERERQTDSYRAELDADAIARGMGASTYVTDVKSREMEKEADDIAELETDYAAQLAERMSSALATERQRAYETDLYNAEMTQSAYDKAYNMALSMLQAYRAGDHGALSLTDAMYA